MGVNANRLERLRSALSDRQQLFMDALPLLFHTNHPAMPGFVSRQTPAQICHFKPNKHDRLVGKMVAKSFTPSYEPDAEDDILSIYIMGSVGTLAQSESSDLDIWICQRPGLAKKALGELESKCDKISRWAAGMRLEVHFFLMDEDTFKQRKFSTLNKESSGSAQQQLLLDEFYRTAIYIAGRIPVWWYVPAHAENIFREYTNTLLYNRFTPSNAVIDFGGVGEIPAGEFLGAGVWQLYKAIESPYKAVLKLLLLEAYVTEYPAIEPLSLTFKSMIYRGQTDIDMLDAYVMVYQRIERHLKKDHQQERLQLARECFYLKVNKPLSKPPTQRAKSWQRLLLEQLTSAWGWSRQDIQLLDNRAQWKAAKVGAEHARLVGELNHCYRILLDFANRYGKNRAIAKHELLVLGRKLQAAFERRPEKIEWLSANISSDLSESALLISRVDGTNDKDAFWAALAQLSESDLSPQDGVVKSAKNLVELLLWCYCNGVITDGTRIEIAGGAAPDHGEIKRVLSCFKHWLPLPLPPAPQQNFQRSSSPASALLLINADRRDLSPLENNGYQRMSDNTDALRYGGLAENLVASVDMVVRNSWNEISVRRFAGDNALVDAIGEYLQMALPGTHQRLPKTTVNCVGNSHASTITQRLQRWTGNIQQCFFSGADAKHKRFIFQIGDEFSCLQYKGMKPMIRGFRSARHLIDYLEQEQQTYSPLVIDTQALPGHPLHLIARSSQRQAVNVFYRRFDIGIEIYVVDERGSLLHSVFRGRHYHHSLQPLARFLRAVLKRQAQIDRDLGGDFGVFPINFIEFAKNERGQWQPHSRSIPTKTAKGEPLDLKAVAHRRPNDQLGYDFHCDDHEFNRQSFGESLALEVSEYILRRRQLDNHYPIYLTDLDLSGVAETISRNGRLQVVHYLRIKNRLEAQLNQAVGIILNV